MSTERTPVFEIHDLDGRVFVRPYVGSVEFNGEIFDTVADARAALPGIAVDCGWTDYFVTYADNVKL